MAWGIGGPKVHSIKRQFGLSNTAGKAGLKPDFFTKINKVHWVHFDTLSQPEYTHTHRTNKQQTNKNHSTSYSIFLGNGVGLWVGLG